MIPAQTTPRRRTNQRSTIPLLLLLCGSVPSCDDDWDPETALDDDQIGLDQPGLRKGTWPPPGGTLNTAWLGNTQLMRLLPPGIALQENETDARVWALEVLTGSQPSLGLQISAPLGDLQVTMAGGQSAAGADLIGSRWWLDANHTHYVTVADYDYDGDSGRHRYRLEHVSNQLTGDAEPICLPETSGQSWAYTVMDVRVDVDNGSVTPEPGALMVACTTGALGKAITWGFSPWATVGPSLDLWETGIRTVRADYCGDGVPYTNTGTALQIFNDAADQDFWASNRKTEAVFGPDGALCMTAPRVQYLAAPHCPLTSCDDLGGAPPSVLTDPTYAWTKLMTFPHTNPMLP
ncbi:MAG: hypothetical protein K0V04_12710 [Deltaproteobacteria bacterium]|nr:hypothetical protein [Deltaproteobacteria bacterium]